MINDLGVTIKWSNNWFHAFSFSGNNVTSFNWGTIFDHNFTIFANFNTFSFAWSWSNLNNKVVAIFPDFAETSDWSDPSLTFRVSRFKKLFYTRKTTRDGTGTGNTWRVFSIKCKLGAQFTKWLGGDNTDRLVWLNELPSCHINTIGFLWNTVYWFCSEYWLNTYWFNIMIIGNLLG